MLDEDGADFPLETGGQSGVEGNSLWLPGFVTACRLVEPEAGGGDQSQQAQ